MLQSDRREAWLTSVNKLRDKYDFIPTLRRGGGTIDCKDKKGNEIGYLIFSYDTNKQELGIVDIRIRKPQVFHSMNLERWLGIGNRGKGVGTALLSSALLVLKDVKSISGTYTYNSTNMLEFKRNLKLSGDKEVAIKNTPGYKMRRKLGFGKIMQLNISAQEIELTTTF